MFISVIGLVRERGLVFGNAEQAVVKQHAGTDGVLTVNIRRAIAPFVCVRGIIAFIDLPRLGDLVKLSKCSLYGTTTYLFFGIYSRE